MSSVPPTIERTSPSGAVLTATKVQIPHLRSGLLRRARLVQVLVAGGEAKVVLVRAPAGSGKTTLLADWSAAAEEQRPFAWFSLDRADNDPVRFFEGVIAALQSVEPRVGEQALVDLAGPASLTDVVLPSLLNDLARLDRRLVTVLDDYHVVTDPRVHEAVTFLVDHQPPTLQLAIASRSEPPLPLPRLRVRRDVVEVRASDLRFTDEEAAALLRGARGLELEAADLERLQDRTEGWAAGLQLAALSLSGHDDPAAFIASFAGDDRPVVDYLGYEVLDGQTGETREFLLQTSILDRLCGPLCDRVIESEASSARLDELERAGLLLVSLDAKRQWYRYHQLFAGLLRHELVRTRPALVPELHRRASAWFRDAGAPGEAIEHAIAAGDVTAAAELITRNWYGHLQRGRTETVAGWLEALGDEVVSGETSLCLTKAWIAVNTGRLDDVAHWIDAARSAGADEPMLDSGVAGLQEIHCYMSGDVEQSVLAGRRSVERGQSPWRPVGCPVLGLALFWSGRAAEAGAELENAAETARTAGNHLAVVHASAGLAAIRAEQGELAAAEETAESALRLAEDRGLGEHWATTLAHVVHGRALEQRGLIAAATEEIDRGVELSRRGVATVEIAYARLAQAEARRMRGDPDGARDAMRHARQALERCADPGIAGDMLARTERRLRLAPRRGAGHSEEATAALSEPELRVLRLLPSSLSQREIGEALYISLNTVKSHARSIYRKLQADSRDQAVERARRIGLL